MELIRNRISGSHTRRSDRAGSSKTVSGKRKTPLGTTDPPRRSPLLRRLSILTLCSLSVAATCVVVIGAFLPLLSFLVPAFVGSMPSFGLRSGPIAPPLIVATQPAGNALCVISVATLRRNVGFDSTGETETLYTGGVYSVLRNPISLGLALIYLGFVLYLPVPLMFIAAGVFVLNTWVRVRAEARMLADRFGDEYRSYRESVGAIIPKPGMIFRR